MTFAQESHIAAEKWAKEWIREWPTKIAIAELQKKQIAKDERKCDFR